MVHEFEGKTEEEAINIAITSLGIKREDLNIETVETKKSFLGLGKNKVKIKVIINEEQNRFDNPTFDEKFISEASLFLTELINKMGFDCKIEVQSKKNNKLLLNIVSRSTGILIGKKGKTLDAIQLLVNVYFSKQGKSVYPNIIIDAENYRARREKSLVSYARKMAYQVRRSRASIILEAMNPFERRLVHTTVNSMDDLDTVSEGEGLYKKVRILYKGR